MNRIVTVFVVSLLLVTVPSGAFASDGRQDAREAFGFDPADPPADARQVKVALSPGQAVVLDVDVASGAMQAHALDADRLLEHPPEPGDVACTNTWNEVLGVFMAPATVSVAVPGAAASWGGSGCSFEPVEVTQTMDHVRLVSAGGYHGGVQAYHHDADGLFTVWCGGTLGYTDRAPEDGDWFWEGPGDLTEEPDTTLVNCYAITRGDVHPSEWEAWSMLSINWHQHAGVVDARVSVS